jgi:hypothetical protein
MRRFHVSLTRLQCYLYCSPCAARNQARKRGMIPHIFAAPRPRPATSVTPTPQASHVSYPPAAGQPQGLALLYTTSARQRRAENSPWQTRFPSSLLATARQRRAVASGIVGPALAAGLGMGWLALLQAINRSTVSRNSFRSSGLCMPTIRRLATSWPGSCALTIITGMSLKPSISRIRSHSSRPFKCGMR